MQFRSGRFNTRLSCMKQRRGDGEDCSFGWSEKTRGGRETHTCGFLDHDGQGEQDGDE